MHLNWFSPLPPARTDIANFTARLLPALHKQANITLCNSTDLAEDGFSQFGEIKDASKKNLDWLALNFADHSIYQIGNDIRFHGPFLNHLKRHGGIVVLHDTNLHETLRVQCLHIDQKPDKYVSLLARFEGSKAAEDGRAHIQGKISLDEMVLRYPLTRTALVGAHGVIVHNPQQLKTVQQLTAAPSVHIPLPYCEEAQLPTLTGILKPTKEPLQMVMFGFLHGENRRLIPFLESWAAMAERYRFRLTLFGEIGDRERLKTKLEELHLRDLVTIHGFLSEEQMSDVLNKSDLAINLRYPTRGEASGALLRIWSHALPTLVSDDGYYTNISDKLVIKVDPLNESAHIQATLRECLLHPAKFREMGANARRALETHTPEAYVKLLFAFLEQVEAYRKFAYLEHYIPRLAHQFIGTIPQPVAQKHWIDRCSKELASWLNAPL